MHRLGHGTRREGRRRKTRLLLSFGPICLISFSDEVTMQDSRRKSCLIVVWVPLLLSSQQKLTGLFGPSVWLAGCLMTDCGEKEGGEGSRKARRTKARKVKGKKEMR